MLKALVTPVKPSKADWIVMIALTGINLAMFAWSSKLLSEAITHETTAFMAEARDAAKCYCGDPNCS